MCPFIKFFQLNAAQRVALLAANRPGKESDDAALDKDLQRIGYTCAGQVTDLEYLLSMDVQALEEWNFKKYPNPHVYIKARAADARWLKTHKNNSHV